MIPPQAILQRAGSSDVLHVNTMDKMLSNTPYADFVAWFNSAVDMEGSSVLTPAQLDAVVGQYLQECNESTVVTALKAGSSPETLFTSGKSVGTTPAPMQRSPGSKAGDLVSFIQHSKIDATKSPLSKAQGKILLHMTVEIGDGRSDTIHVHEGDDPRVLADEFCQTHDLSVNVVEPLADHIKANISKIRAPLASPKKVVTPMEVTKSGRKVDGDQVGRRLTETPTRTPRMSMDPSHKMPPAAPGFTFQDSGPSDHLDELSMCPRTTAAVRKVQESRFLALQREGEESFANASLDEQIKKAI